LESLIQGLDAPEEKVDPKDQPISPKIKKIKNSKNGKIGGDKNSGSIKINNNQQLKDILKSLII
jgi:hypothetical protein